MTTDCSPLLFSPGFPDCGKTVYTLAVPTAVFELLAGFGQVTNSMSTGLCLSKHQLCLYQRTENIICIGEKLSSELGAGLGWNGKGSTNASAFLNVAVLKWVNEDPF